jgi:hypothetical protein
MKNAWRTALALGVNSILAVAVWAVPPRGTAHPGVALLQDAPQLQSVSGKIKSVRSSSFTLQMGEGPPTPGNQLVQGQDRPMTMTFFIDTNTAIDGKLKVGANADVTYRQDNGGNNVAVSVRVAP